MYLHLHLYINFNTHNRYRYKTHFSTNVMRNISQSIFNYNLSILLGYMQQLVVLSFYLRWIAKMNQYNRFLLHQWFLHGCGTFIIIFSAIENNKQLCRLLIKHCNKTLKRIWEHLKNKYKNGWGGGGGCWPQMLFSAWLSYWTTYNKRREYIFMASFSQLRFLVSHCIFRSLLQFHNIYIEMFK